MPATIKIKNSSTASAVPTSSDLVQGELAVNVTDKRIFTENASGTVVELGTNPSILTLPDGSASAPTLTNDGDTNTGLFFPAADTVGITTGGTERARVDSSGNLGLGVTPSTYSIGKVVEVGFAGNSFWGYAANTNLVTQNVNLASGALRYSSTNPASFYQQSSGVHTWGVAPSGTAGNAITFTQAMTLDASGRLLVGSTSSIGNCNAQFNDANGQSALFNSSSASGSYVGWYNSGSARGFIGAAAQLIGGGSASNFAVRAEGDLLFATSSFERARIDSSGNLLVGATSTPGAGSSTTGVGLLAGGAVTIQRAAATPFYCGRSNDGEVMALYSGTTQRGQVSISGATTTYGSFSDYRLKENIVPLTNAVAKVMALKPSTFNFIEFPEQTINGFIAHEVAEVEPIAVTGQKDAVDEEGKQLYQSVDPAKLVPLLTAAIQEQQAIITSLTARITALEQS